MNSVQDRVRVLSSAKPIMAGLSHETKSKALLAIHDALLANKAEIFSANSADLSNAEKSGLASPLLKRLKFDELKLQEVLQGLMVLVNQPNPVGSILYAKELDQGLDLYRVTCPIGTISMIFESRPDALIQMTGLSLKTGNCLILKGGSEAVLTNRVMVTLIKEASMSIGLPEQWIMLLEKREEVKELLALHEDIDLIIPRGSNEFVQYIMKNTLIPVMGHADGICHAYVDKDLDVAMALSLVLDSKTQSVAVCNAIETILIHEAIARDFLPQLAGLLVQKGVTIYGCSRTQEIISCEPVAEPMWKTEYLDYKVSIRIVDSLDMGINHINTYGSKHTELIITNDQEAARYFMQSVDAASVFWNASTRFADGFKFGLGAEVGISTGKLHARGPVGIEGLLTYKYKLFGHGQLGGDYAGPSPKTFTHKPLQGNQDQGYSEFQNYVFPLPFLAPLRSKRSRALFGH